MWFTFSFNILFFFENGKPVVASAEWHIHSQKEYLFWECLLEIPDRKQRWDHKGDGEDWVHEGTLAVPGTGGHCSHIAGPDETQMQPAKK